MKSCGKTLLHSGLIFSLAVMSCSTGCKSMGGWKMPSWFSRQPDADKLAGGKDTTTPTSPANKYAPSAIASNVVKPNSPAGTTPGATTPSSIASKTPQTGILGNSASTSYSPNNPSGGLAAQANGYTAGNNAPSYTTGPYNTTPGKTVSGPTSPNMSGSSTSNPAVTNPTVTSPYGGTYGGSYAGVSSTTAPNTAQGQLPPNLNAGYTGATPQVTQAIGIPQAQSNLGYSAVPAPTDYPSITGGSGYSSPGYTATASGSSQGSNGSNVATGGTVPAVSAYQSAMPATAYAPGTTGRQSNYNFSPGASPAPTSTNPASYNAQPTAQPNNRYLPPNTASGDTTLMR